jgi:hypothetical protein
MFVFDTSAFLNGWRDHLPPTTFSTVWKFIDGCLDDGRVIGPRQVYVEIIKKDDEVAKWAKERQAKFVDPDPAIQGVAGDLWARLYAANPQRNQADPWVIAEAKVRGISVVTYEGRSFSGVPTKNWHRSMPGICQHEGVPCVTLPEALSGLGGDF